MACDCETCINKVATNLVGGKSSVSGRIDTVRQSITYPGDDQDGSHQAALDETMYGRLKGGEHGDLAALRFCNWAAPEYGGTGETFWTNFWQAAQLAIGMLNALIQGEIADLNEKLAESYYQMAKDKYDRWNKKYRPLEEALLEEVSTVEEPELDCDDDRERAENAVNTAYDYIDRFVSAKAKMYRMCLDDTVVAQLNYGRNLMLVDTENYNLIDDQWYVDYKSDQRWSRRSQVLNLGRNLSAQALEYGDIARAMAKNVGDQADKATGAISYQLGYYGSKFDTVYSATYLATAGSAQTSYVGTSAQMAGQR